MRQNIDEKRMTITFRPIIAFWYGFLINKDLENDFQGYIYGTLIFIRDLKVNIML